MRYRPICTIDRSHCAINGSVVSATIDRSRCALGRCGMAQAGLICMGQVARFLVAAIVRVCWRKGKSDLHVWL